MSKEIKIDTIDSSALVVFSDKLVEAGVLVEAKHHAQMRNLAIAAKSKEGTEQNRAKIKSDYAQNMLIERSAEWALERLRVLPRHKGFFRKLLFSIKK